MTMRPLSRRAFLKTTVAGAAVAGAPLPLRAQPKTFKIGAIHPVTGPLAEPGQACRLGAQLAVEAVNAAGGVKGKGGLQLELLVGDTQSKPENGRVEAERVRNALLSAVSHDLRTPLTAITGAASAALEGEARIDAATRRELLESIRDEAERLNRLVNNLLDVTRLESGNLQLRREWIPVEELVGVALARLAAPLRERKVTTRLPEDLPPVLVDGLLIEQVLINLIENATKHTPAGQPIDIDARRAADSVVVEVADRESGRILRVGRGRVADGIAARGVEPASALPQQDGHGVAVQIGVRELMRRGATLRADRSGLLYHRTWLGHGGPTTISADQKSVVANPTSNSDYYQVDIIRPDDGKTNIAHYIADRRDAEMLAARIQHAIDPQA